MSKENADDKCEKKKYDIRGEILLTAFIKKILLAKSEGKTRDYDSLVQKLATFKDKPDDMRKYLFGLNNCVSSLTKEYDTLVGAALLLPWSDKEDEIVDVFLEFLRNLISCHTYYLHACLKMLIKNFSPYVKQGSTIEEPKSDELQKRFQNTHKALQVVVEIVPLSPVFFLPVMIQNYPYLKRPVIDHEFYVKNLLNLTQYARGLHQDILELICINFVKIDVEIPKQALEDDDVTQFDVELEHDGEEEKRKDEDDEKKETMNNEMAERLDILMTMVFEYIHKTCYNEEEYNLDAASDLFDKLLEVFLKVVLPTHDSCHVQFLIFYICSFDEIFVNKFLEACWTKFQDPNTPLILRQTLASYICSLVARAKYIPLSLVRTCLELLVDWIHGYIDEFDASSGRPDVNKHGHFYSLCQAVFYIFVFFHSPLLKEEDGSERTYAFRVLLTALATLARVFFIEQGTTIRARPRCSGAVPVVSVLLHALVDEVCLPTVVQMFARVTSANEVVFCYTIIEKNKRSFIPVGGSSTFSSSVAKHSMLNQLDTFFPFDPYLLKRSRKFITNIYREWEGIEADNEHSDDEEHEECPDIGKTPESLPMASLNSLNEMSISPGFTKHTSNRTEKASDAGIT